MKFQNSSERGYQGINIYYLLPFKDRSHFLSEPSAEMKIEIPKIGARRFKLLQNLLFLCFYAFRVTGNHVCNHLEGYFNRNSNMLLKDFNEISIGFGTTSVCRIHTPPSRGRWSPKMLGIDSPECVDISRYPVFCLTPNNLEVTRDFRIHFFI